MNPSNLPPGCTDNDVDPKMVDCPECDGTGVDDTCDRQCKTCDGTGEVRKDSVNEQ